MLAVINRVYSDIHNKGHIEKYYIDFIQVSASMFTCYNRGCGQTYDPENNSEESCRHHPGSPFFHDAYKGWSCCNKKSVDFTEFLNIKGCTLSKHSNMKPTEPEKLQKDCGLNVVEVQAPIKERLERPPIDMPLITVRPTVAPALKAAIDNLKAKDKAVAVTLATDEIAIGTACKNSGCTYSYTGTAADEDECQHHVGVPIFHEGMKYWSCCQKKTTDFVVFMAQKGCVYGPHKWLKENTDKRCVECRFDWHQTSSNVILSVYAKRYHYAESTIKVNPIRLHVNLLFPDRDNGNFDLDMELRGIIDPIKTTAHMYGTKVEITMPKCEPGSWSNLNFPHSQLPSAQNDEGDVDNQNEAEEDNFNLDDIETVNTGFRLAEISTTKNDGA